MIAEELISPKFPYLNLEDSLEQAIQLFLDNCICHLAVVGKEQIEGILPAEVVMTEIEKTGSVSDFKEDFIKIQAFKNQHGLDLFELVSRLELSSIPVADENNKYLGTVTTQDLLYNLSGIYSFRQVGGVIVLRMGVRDYNLSEISRIVESNNAKILLTYMDMDEAGESLVLTIKVSTLDISRIIATFERFSYKIDFHQPSHESHNELKERYDLLMKMFDI